MTAALALGLIFGAIAPWAIALINKTTWPADRKRFVAGLVTVPFGVLAAIIAGQISVPPSVLAGIVNVVLAVAAAVTSCQAFYRQFRSSVKMVEQATSGPTVVTSVPERTPEQLSREIAAARAKVQASMMVNPQRLDPDDLYAAVRGAERAPQHAPKHALRGGATAVPHGPDNASDDPDGPGL